MSRPPNSGWYLPAQLVLVAEQLASGRPRLPRTPAVSHRRSARPSRSRDPPGRWTPPSASQGRRTPPLDGCTEGVGLGVSQSRLAQLSVSESGRRCRVLECATCGSARIRCSGEVCSQPSAPAVGVLVGTGVGVGVGSGVAVALWAAASRGRSPLWVAALPRGSAHRCRRGRRSQLLEQACPPECTGRRGLRLSGRLVAFAARCGRGRGCCGGSGGHCAEKSESPPQAVRAMTGSAPGTAATVPLQCLHRSGLSCP